MESRTVGGSDARDRRAREVADRRPALPSGSASAAPASARSPRARALRRLLAVALALAPACGGKDDAERELAALVGERPNVLLVTFDTTRADRLGCYGYPAARTPVVDALAAAGTRFTAAHAPTPLTLPSHATLLTGTLPPEHGLRNNGRAALGPAVPHLAEVFAARGWRTGAVVSASVLDRTFGLARGFERYDDDLGGPSEHADFMPASRNAAAVTDAALAWLAALDGAATGDRTGAGTGPTPRAGPRGGAAPDERAPFLLWVHYYDPHFPYEAPARFATDGVEPYDAEIAYTDHELGRLLAGLAERGRLERTLVVLAADHGEALGEHGEPTHGVLVYQATQHVPLVVVPPGGARAAADAAAARLGAIGHRVSSTERGANPRANAEGGANSRANAERGANPRLNAESGTGTGNRDLPAAGRVARVPVDLADVFPTLMELLDWPVPAGVSGRSFAPALVGAPVAPKPLYAESEYSRVHFGWSSLQSLVVDGWKLVRSPNPELYDLTADPHERANLFAREPERAARLDAELDALHASMQRFAAADAQADPDLLARLGALGYATGAVDAERADPFAGRDPAAMIDVLNTYHEAGGMAQLGRYADIVDDLEEVVATCPEGAAFRNMLGIVYRELDRLDESRRELETALALDPRYELAHYNLAQTLAKVAETRGPEGGGERPAELDLALEHYELAAGLNPSNFDALERAARLRIAREEFAEALAHYDRMVALRPEDAQLHLERGYLLRALGRHREMVAAVAESVRRAPGDAEKAAYLAWELATNPAREARDGARAVSLAEELVAATERRDPDLLDTLAAAYAEAGRFADAERTAAEALERARAAGNARLAEQIAARRAGYARREPYRSR